MSTNWREFAIGHKFQILAAVIWLGVCAAGLTLIERLVWRPLGYPLVVVAFIEGVCYAMAASALAFFLWRRSLEHTADFERTLIQGLESSPAGICRLDGKGCVVQCNRAFADFLGYTERELVGMQYAKLLHADETKGVPWSGLTREGSGKLAARIEKYYGKDGEVRWAKTAVSVLGDNASLAGAMVILQDVSSQQEARNHWRTARRRSGTC